MTTLLVAGASLVAQTVKNPASSAGDSSSILGQEDPLEKDMATHSSILAWRILMDRGAWHARYSPRGRKESDRPEVT